MGIRDVLSMEHTKMNAPARGHAAGAELGPLGSETPPIECR